MSVTALVMAGGKGTRMKLKKEKPLLKVGGKFMIEHILSALKNTKKIDEIVVAVSKKTPKTAKILRKSSVKILETPGKDYISDTQYAVKKLKLSTVVTISADLPLVTSEIINEVIERYEWCEKPALAVMIPVETLERLSLEPTHLFWEDGKNLVPAGINVIDGRRINEAKLEEETFILDREEIAVNVNTPRDLKAANRLFERLRMSKKRV